MLRNFSWLIASTFLFSCTSPQTEPPKPAVPPKIFWLEDIREMFLTPEEHALNQQWIDQYREQKAQLTEKKTENTPKVFWLEDPQERPLTPAEQALNQQWADQHQAKKALFTKTKQEDKMEKQAFKKRREAIEAEKQAFQNLLKGKGLSKEMQVRIAGSATKKKDH